MLSAYLDHPEMPPPPSRWMAAIALTAFVLLTATFLLPASGHASTSVVAENRL
jgi:hypothetical protein